MTVEHISKERQEREARAAERAATLEPGDYYASGEYVMRRLPGASAVGSIAVECESHWDACLVLVAIKKEPGNETAQPPQLA